MATLIFPSMQALDSVGKTHKTGFTDGETIVINLYTGSITEQNVEELLDIVHTHELIHTIDMRTGEKEVLHMTKILFKELYKLRSD